MHITMNIYYTGKPGNARKFAEAMINSGIVDQIREEPGNLGYEYFQPFGDPDTILLIDSWADDEALDRHHRAPYIEKIIALRRKYEINMRIERYTGDEVPELAEKYMKGL